MFYRLPDLFRQMQDYPSEITGHTCNRFCSLIANG